MSVTTLDPPRRTRYLVVRSREPTAWLTFSIQRFGESDRRDPAETARIWSELLPLIEAGLIRPAIYAGRYQGLESVPAALHDIATRKVWGKAVIQLDKAVDPDGKARL